MTDLFGPSMTEADRRAQELLDNETLFGKPVARSTDPHTSHEAARRMRPRAGTHRGRTLAAYDTARDGGLTDFELSDLTGIQVSSIGVRRGELTRAGLLEDSGRTRPSPAGSPAIVWVITANGRAVARRMREEEEP